MELHFVDLANVFVYYPYLKRAKFALAHYVHGSVARQNRERELDIEPPHEGRRRQVPAAIDPVARRRRQAKR